MTMHGVRDWERDYEDFGYFDEEEEAWEEDDE